MKFTITSSLALALLLLTFRSNASIENHYNRLNIRQSINSTFTTNIFCLISLGFDDLDTKQSSSLTLLHFPYGVKMGIYIPESLQKMSPEMINSKYPSSGNRPQEVFGTSDGTVSVAFNLTASMADKNNLPVYLDTFKKMFAQPGNRLISAKINTRDGKDYIEIDVVTQATDMKIFNRFCITDISGKLFISTFNCPLSEKEQWENTSKQILHSISIN